MFAFRVYELIRHISFDNHQMHINTITKKQHFFNKYINLFSKVNERFSFLFPHELCDRIYKLWHRMHSIKIFHSHTRTHYRSDFTPSYVYYSNIGRIRTAYFGSIHSGVVKNNKEPGSKTWGTHMQYICDNIALNPLRTTVQKWRLFCQTTNRTPL